MKKKAPNYLINLIPKCEQTIRTSSNHIPSYHCQTDCFKYSFFPSTLNGWVKLDENIRNLRVYFNIQSRLLSLICPVQSNIYHI